MTYSLEFRKKVLSVKAKRGLTFEETSERFDISIRTLFRWQQRLEPCTTRNKAATKVDMVALLEDVRKHPDKYQWERAQTLGVSTTAICMALKRLGVSYKKNTKTSQGRPRKTYSLPGKNTRLSKRG